MYRCVSGLSQSQSQGGLRRYEDEAAFVEVGEDGALEQEDCQGQQRSEAQHLHVKRPAQDRRLTWQLVANSMSSSILVPVSRAVSVCVCL